MLLLKGLRGRSPVLCTLYHIIRSISSFNSAQISFSRAKVTGRAVRKFGYEVGIIVYSDSFCGNGLAADVCRDKITCEQFSAAVFREKTSLLKTVEVFFKTVQYLRTEFVAVEL